MNKLKAIGNSVIIEIAKPVIAIKNDQGQVILHLPEAQTDWHEGIVVSVGPKGRSFGFAQDCKVKVDGMQGLDFEYEGKQYLVVSEHEIIGVMENGKKD